MHNSHAIIQFPDGVQATVELGQGAFPESPNDTFESGVVWTCESKELQRCLQTLTEMMGYFYSPCRVNYIAGHLADELGATVIVRAQPEVYVEGETSPDVDY